MRYITTANICIALTCTPSLLAHVAVDAATLGALILPPRLALGISARRARAPPPAVALATIATTADQAHLIASRTLEPAGIVHRTPGNERWTTRENTWILAPETRESADLGAAPDMTATSM